jgi:hypothetical protein
MHNSQHTRALAKFPWPTLEHAQDVSAEFGSLENCSCFEKVTYPAEPDVDFAIHLELDEVRKGLSLRDGAGAEGAGTLSNRLTEALERDDHAVGMLWALLAGRDDEPNGHGWPPAVATPPDGGSAPRDRRAATAGETAGRSAHPASAAVGQSLPFAQTAGELGVLRRVALEKAPRPVHSALGRGGVSDRIEPGWMRPNCGRSSGCCTTSHRSHPFGTGKSAVCTRRYRPRNWTSRCDTSPGRA